MVSSSSSNVRWSIDRERKLRIVLARDWEQLNERFPGMGWKNRDRFNYILNPKSSTEFVRLVPDPNGRVQLMKESTGPCVITLTYPGQDPFGMEECQFKIEDNNLILAAPARTAPWIARPRSHHNGGQTYQSQPRPPQQRSRRTTFTSEGIDISVDLKMWSITIEENSFLLTRI